MLNFGDSEQAEIIISCFTGYTQQKKKHHWIFELAFNLVQDWELVVPVEKCEKTNGKV